MKDVFDKHYLEQYKKTDLLDKCGGELQHLISDAATMQIIRWTGGGFGMAAHNYDGDMLTDEVAQVHRSPGFITSNLIGKKDDGTPIAEYEASHGTVADLWHMHLRGEETSLNPLGLAEALIGAMNHSAKLFMADQPEEQERVYEFTKRMRESMHKCMVAGQGTRDLCGPEGLTTEGFIDVVASTMAGNPVPEKMTRSKTGSDGKTVMQPALNTERGEVDFDAIKAMFASYDLDGNGQIDAEEFSEMIVKLGVAPKKM